MAFAPLENGERGRIEAQFFWTLNFCFFQLNFFAMKDHDQEMEKILISLDSIEARLTRLESALNIAGDKPFVDHVKQLQAEKELDASVPESEEKGIESQIGRFGLAWLGNIVLLFGIIFLTQYIMTSGSVIVSFIIGYIMVASLFFLAGYIKNTNTHLASILRLNSQVLLFYLTVRLHFFSATPLIPIKSVSIGLLLVLVAIEIYLSIRDGSQLYAGIAVLFSLAVANLGDSTNLTLPLLILPAAGTVYLYHRFSWEPLVIITIFLTYACFILWLFGNPLMGHPMQIRAEDQFGVVYLLGLGACFSAISLFRKKDSVSDDYLISVIVINGILFTLLLLLFALRFFADNYVALFTTVTVFSLVYSIILHRRSEWNFASAFYALYGFMAMSIALYGIVGFPTVCLYLSVQSLLVVSMALWFRNRLIIIMNSLLFLSILVIYLLSGKNIVSVNFSFALIALISARIINWKKSRLRIETDMIRNLYMIEGFLMMLFALLHSVPRQFVTFSWTMAALLYFIISLLLKNIKYRYMALGTMICSAFYLFIVDLARIGIIYRVLALLFLAAISIGISIYYTNRIKKA
jgi:hypothetical protein